MSGFARIPNSLPIVGDIGVVWPILATMVADALDVKLEFMTYKQTLPEGVKMREWIVKHVEPINRDRLIARVKDLSFLPTKKYLQNNIWYAK